MRLQFGLGPAGLLGVRSAAAWRDLARRAEDRGFDALCLGDHLDERAAPAPTAIAVAGATSTLRVGVHVYANDFRHPLLLIREINTTAMLLEGRFDAGVGAGWMAADYERAGFAFDRPGARLARLAETVELLRRSWTDDRLDLTSDSYTIRDAPGRAMLGGAPPPRLVMGGGGERMLALAARHADVVSVNVRLDRGRLGPERGATATDAMTRAKIDVVRAAAPDRFDALTLQVELHYVEVGADYRGALDRAAAEVGMSPDEAARSPHVLVGSPDRIRDTLHARHAEYGFSYFCMSAAHLDAFAPVIAGLC